MLQPRNDICHFDSQIIGKTCNPTMCFKGGTPEILGELLY